MKTGSLKFDIKVADARKFSDDLAKAFASLEVRVEEAALAFAALAGPVRRLAEIVQTDLKATRSCYSPNADVERGICLIGPILGSGDSWSAVPVWKIETTTVLQPQEEAEAPASVQAGPATRGICLAGSIGSNV